MLDIHDFDHRDGTLILDPPGAFYACERPPLMPVPALAEFFQFSSSAVTFGATPHVSTE